MCPAIAEAVTVAGDAIYISEEGLPIRPIKFRLEDAIHRSPEANNPICAPGHGPHVGLQTRASDRRKVSISPALSAC